MRTDLNVVIGTHVYRCWCATYA